MSTAGRWLVALVVAVGALGRLPAPATAVSAPVNDDFAQATVLGGNAGAVDGTTEGATVETAHGEKACPFTPSSSVWYRWTPSESGPARVALDGTDYDTTLEVCLGPGPSKLTAVAASNDANGSAESEVDFAATAGVTYRIRVDGAGAATGSFTLSYGVNRVANDDFADAEELTGAAGNVAGSVVRATAEAGEPILGSAARSSVWFSWTVPETGVARVTTAGSGIRNLLVVWTGDDLATLGHIAANDLGLHGTSLQFDAVAGTTYRISVTGSGTLRGSFQLDYAVDPPGNDQFASALSIPPFAESTPTMSTARATGEPEEPTADLPISASMWFSWKAPSSGTARISLAAADFDAVVEVFTGADLFGLTEVAVNDEFNGTHQPLVEFTAVFGTTYRILVDAGTDAQSSPALGRGAVSLDIGLGGPGNDLFSHAVTLTGGQNEIPGTVRQGTIEPGEPAAPAGLDGDNSVWYAWTAPSSGSISFSAVSPSEDLSLRVFRGSDITSLTQVAADDDSGRDLDPTAAFPATAGTTYRILVAGSNFGSGDFELRWSPVTCQVVAAGTTGLLADPGGDREVASIVGAGTFSGSEGDDVIVGSSGDDVIDGRGGDDVVCGGGGADAVIGGDGDDLLAGGNATDQLFGGSGADRLVGGSNNDQLFDGGGADLDFGGDGVDTMFAPGAADDPDVYVGGPGEDTITYDSRITGVSIRLDNSRADDGQSGEGDQVLSTERGTGGAGVDILVGTAGDNVLIGNDGEDHITGGLGADKLLGLSGPDDLDALDGVAGNDTVNGGPGADTAHADPGDVVLSVP